MPAGKAIASVAMPTAVLVGMGFTSTLALADTGSPAPSTSKSLTADEYKDCVSALDDAKDSSASPSPSASASKSADTATPSPSASADASKDAKDSGTSSSSDSGSGDKATPQPTATSGSSGSGSGSGGSTATPTPSASQSSGGGLLGTIGDTLGGILGGGKSDSGSTSADPTPSASPSSSSSPSQGSGTVNDTVSKTTKTVTDTVKKATDTVKKTTDTVSKAAGDATKAVQDAAGSVTPSPSASSSTSPQDCPTATTDVGGVDNTVPVADDPWYLDASSLLLKGADYQGIVEVKTASGATKKVLKYVVSDGTDIGDLHQTVLDKASGKTYHVQAAKGSTSTIRGGSTVMYTEKISGNLFGLIPMTFTPDSPPPLNLPLIYFTNVKVTQAAQFGGNLHVPGMHVYTTG
jgi:hypothetical protein